MDMLARPQAKPNQAKLNLKFQPTGVGHKWHFIRLSRNESGVRKTLQLLILKKWLPQQMENLELLGREDSSGLVGNLWRNRMKICGPVHATIGRNVC